MTKIFTTAENKAWAQTLPGKMTSACLAITSSNQVLMVKAAYKDHWTFPSGIVDTGESPKMAAVRETYEETGLQFSIEASKLLAVIYTTGIDGSRDRFNVAFTVQVDTQIIPPSIPNDEVEQAAWVDIGDIARWSGGKASYVQLQAVLLREKHDTYIEVS